MPADPWLVRWLPLIRRHATGLPVLEIGCGDGADTATLTAAGLDVLAFDRSAQAIERARQQVPTARFMVRDVRDPFPLDAHGAGAVLASLSLHYFPWAETVALFERVRRTLTPGGLLVCRLNSTQDLNFGAAGHPAIEPGFYSVDGEPKRFFDRAAAMALVEAGWQLVSLEHRFTGKYAKPKALWELVCTARGADGAG